MVPSIDLFQTKLHPFGNEIDIRWEVSQELTTQKLYIFKSSKGVISDEAILKYARDPIKENVPEGDFVFTGLESYQKEIRDFKIEDGNTYYFKGIVVDKNDRALHSGIVASSIKAKPMILEMGVVDCKKSILEGMKKIMGSIAKQIGANIKVYEDFPLEAAEGFWVVISRVSGEIAYKFWSDVSSEYGNEIIRGDIDTDVIQITWLAKNSPSLRDQFTKIMRGIKPKLKRMLMYQEGMMDTRMTITGDAVDNTSPGNLIHIGSMLVNCLIQNTLTTENEEDLIKEIKYEFSVDIEGSEE